MVRIAYCLLVHKNPAQVRRLIERLSEPGDRIYVNVFKAKTAKAQDPWRNALREPSDSDLKIVFAYGSGWGHFRLVAATLDAMRYFGDFPFDYFVNLTGQCYPIRAIEETKRFLGESDRTFMKYKEYPSPLERATGPIRGPSGELLSKVKVESFTHRHYRLVRREFGIVLKVPRLRATLPNGMRPFRGSPYFCMRREHAAYILRFVDEHPDVVRFFRRAGWPDEAFFQTILMNSPFRDKVTNLRTTYTLPSGSTPRVLGMQDLPDLLQCDKFWARKFDMAVDREILGELDSRLVRLGPPTKSPPA